MKKKILLIFLLTFLGALQAQTLLVDGVNYSVDTLENHQVGPGTQFTSLRLTTATKRLDVFFLKTDLKNPHIEVRTALGRDSIYGGEQPSVLAKRLSSEKNFYFAGTNGDFYETTGYVGYPVSGNMANGEIARIPGSRNVFTIDDLKTPDIGIMSYSGNIKFGESDWTIHSVNHLRGENKLVLFNRHNGKYTHTNSYGTEVLIELEEGYTWGSNKTLKAKVLQIEKGKGNMAIPKGKAVLSGHGTAADNLNKLAVNDVIDLKLNLTVNSNNTSNFLQMTGGDNYKTMLLNGVVEQGNVWNELHPRTGLGYSQAKDTVIFCVIDGRGVSAGATTKQLAEVMKSGGAYTAFNMDGGGSSAMYVAEYGGPVNKTSDPGGERAVANSVFVVSTAPTDTAVAVIKPHDTSYLLPYLGEYIPKFYAYNQYGTLLSSDLQGVMLSCPESLGVIDGNKLIVTGTTPGKLTAIYKENVTATIDISFLPVSGIKIRLDSVLMDNRKDYPIEVLAVTSAGEALISANAFSWEVQNPEICVVINGNVRALKNGTTKLTGTINEVTDDIIVKVEIPETPVMVADRIHTGDWTMSASSFLNAQWNTDNRPQYWETGSVVNFVHAAGRAPFIKLTNNCRFYGLPDTIKLILNAGDIAFTRAIVSLRANNDTKSATREFNSFEQNRDLSLDIPVDQIFDANDCAIYPIGFDNVNFYIDPTGMIAAKSYSLALKEIALAFKDYIISFTSPEKLSLFQVYPNPVKDGSQFTLRINDEMKNSDLKIRIYNVSGQQVFSTVYGVPQTNELNVPVRQTPGTYFLEVSSGSKTETIKMVVR